MQGAYFSFESGLQLVKQQQRLMDRASIDGMMAPAVHTIKSPVNLKQYLTNTPDVVLANDNNDGQ
jgi:hypothetical protein